MAPRGRSRRSAALKNPHAPQPSLEEEVESHQVTPNHPSPPQQIPEAPMIAAMVAQVMQAVLPHLRPPQLTTE